MQLTIQMELFVEIYNRFEAGEEKDVPEKSAVQQDLYWFFHDYSEIFYEKSLRRLIDPAEDFENDIVMNADLNDLRYLYRYGVYIGENEKKMAAFLNRMTDEEIQAMADTYTEGYRIGFEVTGKDLGKKQTVQLRYPIGFERMVRVAVRNFEKMNLKPTMLASATSPNKQFDYDHSEDRALYLDKAYVERCLGARKNYFEEEKKLAAGHAGPAVIEVFGEVPFSPENKERAVKYNEKQQKICVYEMNMAGQMINEYIKGEERSFTIIAYPIPEIGDRFEEIFAETVKLNTLDYKLYQTIQQKIIDVLDTDDTLPMGEFAIGTNTTAYRMARDYQIADKLPILIAEKTGPHFAVGDTCYSHEEDNISYNPDGKAIVARENSVSAQRKESVEKAYLNCHTDITIPYDELDKITVIRKDGSTEDIIADGKFVLAGTEQLNEPLL